MAMNSSHNITEPHKHEMEGVRSQAQSVILFHLHKLEPQRLRYYKLGR